MLYPQNLHQNTVSRKWSTTCLMLLAVTALVMMPDIANAAGLAKASSGLEKFSTEIQPMLRIVGGIAIMLTGMGYMANMVDKSMFVKIIAGIIIVASAGEIVAFFW